MSARGVGSCSFLFCRLNCYFLSIADALSLLLVSHAMRSHVKAVSIYTKPAQVLWAFKSLENLFHFQLIYRSAQRQNRMIFSHFSWIFQNVVPCGMVHFSCPSIKVDWDAEESNPIIEKSRSPLKCVYIELYNTVAWLDVLQLVGYKANLERAFLQSIFLRLFLLVTRLKIKRIFFFLGREKQVMDKEMSYCRRWLAAIEKIPTRINSVG